MPRLSWTRTVALFLSIVLIAASFLLLRSAVDRSPQSGMESKPAAAHDDQPAKAMSTLGLASSRLQPDASVSSGSTDTGIVTGSTVRIQFLDSETLAPVPRTSVYLDALLIGSADEAGAIALPQVVDGALTASSKGHASKRFHATAPYQEVLLSKVEEAIIRLVTASGSPVPNVSVTRPEGGPVRPDSYSAGPWISDQEGAVSVPVIEDTLGRSLIRIEPPGMPSQAIDLAPRAREIVVVVDACVVPLTVAFQDTLGRPLVQKVVHGLLENIPFVLQTGESGTARVPIIPAWTEEGDSLLPDSMLYAFELYLDGERVWCERHVVTDAWTAAPFVITVDYSPIRGVVRSSSPQQLEIASAIPLCEQPPRHCPYPSDALLLWSPVAADGTFLLENGYQGPSTLLVIKDKANGGTLGAFPASRPVSTIDLERTGTVRLSVRTPIDDGFLLLKGMGVEVAVPQLPADLPLPLGVYQCFYISTPGTRFRLSDISVRPGVTKIVIEIPSSKLLTGTARGSLGGPLRGVSLRVSTDCAVTTVHTKEDGSFFAALVGDPASLELRLEDVPSIWNDYSTKACTTWKWTRTEPLEVALQREEGRMVVVLGGALLADCDQRVHIQKVHNGRRIHAAFTESSTRESEVLLPPGSYHITPCIGDREIGEPQTIELEAGGAKLVETPAYCGSAITFTVDRPRNKSVELRATLFRGSTVVDSWNHLVNRLCVPVAPGEYEILVMGRVFGEKSSWDVHYTTSIICFQGAVARVVVPLE